MGAWVGVQDNIVGKKTDWVQVGYMKKRWGSNGFTDSFAYIEVSPFDDTTPIAIISDLPGSIIPVESDDYLYECVIDPDYGSIFFRFPSTGSLNLALPLWTGRTLNYISWQGEIDGRETDMPGTDSHPCIFDDCAYWINDGSVIAYPATFGGPI